MDYMDFFDLVFLFVNEYFDVENMDECVDVVFLEWL